MVLPLEVGLPPLRMKTITATRATMPRMKLRLRPQRPRPRVADCDVSGDPASRLWDDVDEAPDDCDAAGSLGRGMCGLRTRTMGRLPVTFHRGAGSAENAPPGRLWGGAEMAIKEPGDVSIDPLLRAHTL
jgi:hypothetical protein